MIKFNGYWVDIRGVSEFDFQFKDHNLIKLLFKDIFLQLFRS